MRGDLNGQRYSQRQNQIENHFSACGGRRVEPVDLAVFRIARMVIDVEDERAIESRDAGARQVAALHDDRRIEAAVDGRSNPDVPYTRKTHQLRWRRVEIEELHMLA